MSAIDRRLIEDVLPLRELSVEATHEQNVRGGHIDSLHIWWARRPLAACRSAVLASLINEPDTETERKRILNFLTCFSKWENSNDKDLIQKGRELIRKRNNSIPKILDCFAGGGAIPLEAQRLGCETYALELNPVATLILLCTNVYPQKYGKAIEVSSSIANVKGEPKQLIHNRLARDVERWGKWIFEEAQKEIGHFYPPDTDGAQPLAYLWARTLPCPNPKCHAQVPLIKQLWLANTPDHKVALKMLIDTKHKSVSFKVVENDEVTFDPKKATIRLGSMRCPVCKEGTLDKFEIKRVAREQGIGTQPLVVVVTHPKKGRIYRLFKEADLKAFAEASKMFEKFRSLRENGLSAIPTEPISTDYDWVLKPPMFGITKWGEMFNPRQAVALVTFSRLVKRSFEKVFEETQDREYSKAVTTYLALTFDSMAHYLSVSSTWLLEHMISTFIQGQAIPFRWDYGESNPFGERVGTWNYALNQTIAVLNYLCANELAPAVVQQGLAQRLPFPDAMFDAVITDPPYYDMVPYSDLSDFFYVWLKRMLGKLYPDLLSTPLAPKSDELVQQSGKVTSAPKRLKDKNFYESGIEIALREANRVLKPDGVCVVVFAHKTLFAWESLIKALIQAGFAITSSWPLHTERRARMRAYRSAVLASSVWLVCRKRNSNAEVGSWKTTQRELDERVRERLDFFLGEGIKGADALLSAIGPALEVFSRYNGVKKIDGAQIAVGDFLDKVREVVAHHALSTVLSEQELGNVDSPTAFYVLWRWTFEPGSQNGKHENSGGKGKGKGNGNHIIVPYDDALKLARSVGADPEILLKTHVLEQEKEYVRLLAPNERKHVPGLGERTRDGTSPATIDMIHRALNLWAAMEQAQLEEYLEKSGAKNNEIFWRVAQALSNLLPLQSKEKQLLDGLLARHAGGAEASRPREVRSLDEFVKKEEK